MWIIKRSLLVALVNEAVAVGQLSFEKDIIAKRAHSLKIFGYKFEGYAAKIDSNRSLFEANMDLLDKNIRNEIFKKNYPIYTKVRDEAPTRYGSDVTVKNSLIANGSLILSDLENCVVSRGVYIGKGAKVKTCVIMQGAVIGDNADISYAIIDKKCVIKNGRVLAGHSSYPFVLEKNSIV
jgi:glucose-1-phosphate adenylyltransferase